MKIQFKILPFILALLMFNSCKNNHEDGHNHEAETSAEQPNTAEESHSVTALTDEQIKAAGISYGTIEMKLLTAVLQANGNIKVPNNNKAMITSLYGGVIKSIHVESGKIIAKGQVIATIANPQFIQLQEEYLTINSKITFAEQELQRQTELSEGNAGAKKNLQSITAELNGLKIRKASLFQQIQLMGINPSTINNSNLKTTINVLSPINGVVSTLFAKIGSYVDVAAPIAEIIDNQAMHVDLNIFEKDISNIKLGQSINFRTINNPDNQYEAVVHTIGSSFENETKSIAVHCDVKGNRKGLIDGMSVVASISLHNILTASVPDAAIVNFEGKDFIFIITDKIPEIEKHEDTDEHGHQHEPKKTENENIKTTNFERIEVLKGVSNMGFTAITPVVTLPENVKIAVKGTFFINAKLVNTGEHEH